MNRFTNEINVLKKEKNAVILAHFYQRPEIQEAADFVGDSLALSIEASKTSAEIIVFAGVHFMAETAKIINPNKKVLLPDLLAGCSLAESCSIDKFESFVEEHPDHIVVSYINCSAGVKALSDIVCTSSNALKIIESIRLDQPIIFAPDKNLGKYIAQKTGRDMVLWDGVCVVHEAFSIEKLLHLHKEHPKARVIAHPESEAHILKAAHYIGSTAQMINYVKKNSNEKYIVATEAGILHRMRQEAPNTELIPAPAKEDNSCACSECAYMKVNTLKKVYKCLTDEAPEIIIPADVINKASIPIRKMLEFS